MVEGTFRKVPQHGLPIITSLIFKTSKQRTSPPAGNVAGTRFVLEKDSEKIVGFHGRSAAALDALGVYFAPLSPAQQPQDQEKVEAQGGKGGKEWDDGGDHDGVTKIFVGIGRGGLQYIKFDYVQLNEGPIHGTKERTFTQPFEITHPDEYIVSVEGYYDDSGIIQGLRFKTNKRTSDIIGYGDDGTKFILEVKDKKIVGFHGYADKNLNSLGAYFVPISSSSSPLSPPNKVGAQGGKGGNTFDDGAFDSVRKVYVGQGDIGVSYVKFHYDNSGNSETRDHGKKTLLGTEDFVLEYPDEYITSVEGTYDKIYGSDSEVITSLTFKTSKGRTSQPFGIVAGISFTLDGKGGKLLGFHGQVGEDLYALGAYFAPTSTPLIPPKKLEAKGGEAGNLWDDGVKKLLVGQGDIGISFVKFAYVNGTETVVGDGRGKK
ncbi:PREDICTED: myrosinase-binding protein 2-like [Tarenaya hassleriana]|uniref:myrosinase-binding protein 2-like n=1 Tax=Tarenaya hassleriana TaxID=28532 RepID=UPI0008FD8854|nr:PREDICTED: myrosinase-binding protein 2-like [Tarenaya hassleriana]XP_019058556.1 PREDICTED: myrosinase-binding protein 2-like [Tarenaya hassleriana]